tara:strand:- start:135 stop:485 length:351 start_codon:yes stop_codon:yes gene_type:complete
MQNSSEKILGLMFLCFIWSSFSQASMVEHKTKQTIRKNLSTDYIFAETFESIFGDGTVRYCDKSIFNKIECATDKVNPLKYFKKKKMCQQVADASDTVAIGKEHYKHCMKYPSEYR